jgi:hypothetical protein
MMQPSPLVIAFLLAGCANPSTDGNDTEHEVLKTPYERDLAPKIQACVYCHSGEEAKAGLDLVDIQVNVDAPSSQINMALISPGNHLQSYLWHKVAGTQSIAGGLGQRMPLDHQWSDEDVEFLATWIDLGAPL